MGGAWAVGRGALVRSFSLEAVLVLSIPSSVARARPVAMLNFERREIAIFCCLEEEGTWVWGGVVSAGGGKLQVRLGVRQGGRWMSP